MADLHIDSQLMSQMLPARLIDNKKHLLAVHDENHQPLVFACGTDGHLHALKSNFSGSNHAFNVSAAIGVRGTVENFIVKQADDADRCIFLAFSSKVNDSAASDLHILAPFKPEILETPDQLSRYVISGPSGSDKVKINSLHMGPAATSDTSGWPLLVASYSYLTDNNKDANISRILVEGDKWRWTSDLQIYEQANTIISMFPGSLSVGDGLFVLYRRKQTTALMFTTIATNDDSPWTSDLRVPDGSNVNSISTYIDPDGYTGLFLAGDGLWHISAQDAIDLGNGIEKISSDDLYQGATNTHVAQSGETVSIWFSNSDGVLGYQHANNSGKNDQMLIGDPVPLRLADTRIDYSAIVDPSTKSQSFIVAEDTGTLLLMEQAVETDMWNSRSLLVNQPNELTEINAFVSHVELQDSRTKQPLSNTQVNVTASGWVNLLINGAEYMVGQDKPVTVKTNVKGVLTIIQPSDGISAYTYTFSDLPNSPIHVFPSGPVTVDPSDKVQDKLQNFGSVAQLQNAGATGSLKDLEAAANAIRLLNSAKNDLIQKDSRYNSPAIVRVKSRSLRSASHKHTRWGWFEWIKRHAKQLWDFFVEKAKDAWHFTVTIAQKTWRFVVNSVTAVVKGIQLVLEKIGIGLEKIWKFVKYIFEWDDIRNTYQGLKNIVNSGLDYGIKIVGEETEKVGKIFDGLEAQLDRALKVKLPDGYGAKKQSRAEIESGSSSAAANYTKNVEVNNATYHFEEGRKTAEFQPATSGDAIRSLWDDVIEPTLKSVEEGARQIMDRVWTLIQGELKFSVEDIYAVIGGELIHLVVTLIKTVVQGLMKIGKTVLSNIKDLLNARAFSFGIFGGLIKKLFHVSEFSILDVVALVFAIPSTILAKIITGKAPKRIQSFDFARMVEKGPTDDETMLAYSELGGYVLVCKALYDVIINMKKILTVGLPIQASKFSAVDLAEDLVGLLVGFPWNTELPGRDFRIAIWGVLFTNTIILSISTKSVSTNTLKIMAASDILVGLSTFSLAQVAHHEQLTHDWKGRDDERTALSISRSVFEVVEKVSTAVGILVPALPVRMAAGVVMSGAATCKAVAQTGIAAKQVPE